MYYNNWYIYKANKLNINHATSKQIDFNEHASVMQWAMSALNDFEDMENIRDWKISFWPEEDFRLTIIFAESYQNEEYVISPVILPWIEKYLVGSYVGEENLEKGDDDE